MTDAEALQIADTPDWWIPPGGDAQSMRTLRAALMDAAGAKQGLFRPGGFGAAAIWLSEVEVARLAELFPSVAPKVTAA